MARVKRAVNAQKKRRTTLERAAGYRGQRSRLYRKNECGRKIKYKHCDLKMSKKSIKKAQRKTKNEFQRIRQKI